MPLPTTVSAITFSRAGDLDVIEKTQQPFPTNAPGNVLVKLHYGGVNMINTYFKKGLYKVDLPYIVGQEGAGIVVGLPSDPAVLNDEEFQKRSYAIGTKVAVYFKGCFAEYGSFPWKDVYPIPESVSLRDATACLTQGMTALSFITEAYNVQKGDYILVHTIAGGLGLAFAQLLKARGAIVIGTTSTPEKAEFARRFGADYVILYPTEDTVQRVLEITNGQGVHAVYDGVGKDTFENNFKLLRRKGTLVSVGNTSGTVPPFPPLKLGDKNIRLLRPLVNNYVALPAEGRYYSTELFKLIADGTLKVNVYKEYSFTADGVRESQRDMTERKTVGKSLVRIVDNALL